MEKRERPLKHILLKLDPAKKREKDVILTLEQLKTEGLSHKAAVIYAFEYLKQTQHGVTESSAPDQTSDVILAHLKEMKQLFLQGRSTPQPEPLDARLETIGVSKDVITADEIDNF